MTENIESELYSSLAWTLRFLAIDMVERAKSGHPGMPMGFADVVTVLYRDFLVFNPHDPTWSGRDRFILSAGHGSALLYALLYLNGYKGYDLTNLKKFRQLGSCTPGHPEINLGLGVEVTTGPLGQGLANAVGIALSSKIIATKIGQQNISKVYVVVGDGCLMEGISHEALSLAGHLKLNNLVVLFDNNNISIDGKTSLTCSDNILKRLESYNFEVSEVDGHDHKAIYNSLSTVRDSNKPVFIAYKTKIGFGSPTFENSHLVHGKSLGTEEIEIIKKKFSSSIAEFDVNISMLKIWQKCWIRNEHQYKDWKKQKQTLYEKIIDQDVDSAVTVIEELKKKYCFEKSQEATRKSSNTIIQHITETLLIIGGSADLSESNGTKVIKHVPINSNNYSGNYLHYGIREHAMVAIMNGMSICGLKTYGGSFLVFSDYCRPAIRLAAVMKLPVIIIFTHDGIGVGEDGPTHQPVEQLASLRAVPNLQVFRPADAVETCECWQIILQIKTSPSVLCLTRQDVPQIERNTLKTNLSKLGAYIIYQSCIDRVVTIFASGSEVDIGIKVAKILLFHNVATCVVSVPCQELFWEQDKCYRDSLLHDNSLKVAIEVGVEQSWSKIIGNDGLFFGIKEFGKSGSVQDLYKYFSITEKDISKKILSHINTTKYKK